MNRPINQHSVPRFYLKHFSTPETKATKQPKVWVFSKDDGDPIRINTRNICAKRYLYSPESEAGQRDWALDSKINDLEDLLTKLWPALADDFVDLNAESIRKAVALFVAVLYLRHPSNFEFVTHLHQQLVSMLEHAPRDTEGIPSVDEVEISGTKLQLDRSGWWEYKNWDKAEHHKFFVSIVQSEAEVLATLLLKKRWSVVYSEDPVFITSDNPVSRQHQSKSVFGFGTEGTIVMFPVSPKRLLVIDDRLGQSPGQYYALSGYGPGPQNLLIWRNGTLMISHRHPDLVMEEMMDWAER